MVGSFFIFLIRVLTGVVVYSRGFGFEPERQRIYYANHSSHLDTILIWSVIPADQRGQVHPAAAKDYWWKDSVRSYLADSVFRAVPVIRHKERGNEDPLLALRHVLGIGESLIIFPEGTRGDGQSIDVFKSGIYHLVADFPDVDLVPVYIHNVNRVLPKGRFLPVPILCTITFGAPIKLQSGESKQEFLDRARQNLERLAPS